MGFAMLRRPLGLIIAASVILLFTTWGFLTTDYAPRNVPFSVPFRKAAPPTPPPSPLHVDVIETGGSHDEVTAALVYAFSQLPSTTIGLYLLLKRYGISEIYDSFFPTAEDERGQRLIDPNRGPDGFSLEKVKTTSPDVVVLTTCELDIFHRKEPLGYLLQEGKTHLFCTIHHADRWNTSTAAGEKLVGALKPWVEAGSVTFLTLSEHVSKYLHSDILPTWPEMTSPPNIQAFAPVFPVVLKNEQPDFAITQKETAFTLQGDFDAKRRNYTKILSQLREMLKSGSETASTLTMHLLGHGPVPTIPEEVAGHVKIDKNLDYVPFYSTLSKSFALITAFASETYFTEKASSSVPASLISGCPLVADRKLLDTYTYLNEDVVWLKEEGEDDMDAVKRVVMEMGEKEFREKSERVRERNRGLYVGNVERFGGWVEGFRRDREVEREMD
ncbi:hypothetical protein SAICODRAFT_25178 [Saitoella complicata NRRL Y-17804]|uniref:Glycosyl transferase family 1 domain-containing protein n=1 Tax=Saitoella complicata (strain BCRC 22490 / CBS 7301 / JCM 7358 / NBRC 10748 / NRRL Y-17804) TaxID=698492 RepID=A0A0E9NMQ1_SAICN|nr:uncharacterized protein SAICODRAFT_25178 [Saitoella complicata NRRL Y-17804]ODQ53531.1 hypothetical protein SAICODRAFT_25178 [Saitoella complicata NRRL Y-17804]GAO51078.1 hypothetical protein G7K_5190-t1 [Saitoella complicata NRRL Y-17804]